ncbi:MAG: isopentenyl phosphate kinase [Candidatus Thermoplasmatota archaeon]|jgi:isopentenyl phosphate kinase|nr:isopentenyl phosphate kinase [Candidatus Thermoplasmatota archaeon]MCL5984926.1 isopentenyl phosphate kinase [Candidatus Thermoplasmatota archaeon]
MGVLVVKLGGSILTRKREESSLRKKVLARLAKELAEGWQASGKGGLVVLHGAGSFGHPWARKWHLADPPSPSDRDRVRGAALTSYHVRILHNAVLRALLDAGLPALSFPPLPISGNKEGNLAKFDLAPLTDAIAGGSIPLTFGDVVRDEAWGYSILSGDDIALELAAKTKVDRVIFVSDVDGILSPKAPHTLVPRLTEGLLEELKPTPGVPDVTGGIRGKAETMLAIGRTGTRTVLLNGLSGGRLKSAVAGEEVYGTWA